MVHVKKFVFSLLVLLLLGTAAVWILSYRIGRPLRERIYTPSEIDTAPIGEVAAVQGIARLGERIPGSPVTCTELACPSGILDCNHCFGPLVLEDIKRPGNIVALYGEFGDGKQRARAVNCERLRGIWACYPLMVGREYLIRGVLSKGGSIYWIDLKQYDGIVHP